MVWGIGDNELHKKRGTTTSELVTYDSPFIRD